MNAAPTVVRRALLSVSDKTGIVDLAQALAERGIDILSTGGTARAIRDAGLAVTDVSEVTGFPEIMDGRVKPCIPRFTGAFLADGVRTMPSWPSMTSPASTWSC